jgi:sterol desaturase/sphingolipid hydroxylase (fatty acid hydroxylase superfamily)
MAARGVDGRLFDSDLLERLSRVHPVTPALVWVPLIAVLLWRSLTGPSLGSGTWVTLAAAGLLVWTLTEYAVHRFLFHLSPTTAWRRRLQFILHGIHHAHPGDRTRLLMPLAPAAIGHGAFYGLFRGLLGPIWVEPFFAFFLLGYLAYDYIHFALHHGTPRSRLRRQLRRWHMLHHFGDSRARWGVSSPLWDVVFRTAGDGPRGRSRGLSPR